MALSRGASSGMDAPSVGAGHSFMSNFTQAAGAIDAAEVDPVAEAEVYIAYGRDVQAEDILRMRWPGSIASGSALEVDGNLRRQA